MPLKFKISAIVPATPTEVYKTWLDSKGHTKMTGSKAKISDKVGAAFEAWDGYITGANLELLPSKLIVQSWRTTEFDETDQDSRLEIILLAVRGGTKVTLSHSNLPTHGEQYRQGWVESYFEPMKAYFEEKK